MHRTVLGDGSLRRSRSRFAATIFVVVLTVGSAFGFETFARSDRTAESREPCRGAQCATSAASQIKHTATPITPTPIAEATASARSLAKPASPRRSAATQRSELRRPQRTKSRGAVYWGAQIGDHLTGMEAPYDMSAVTAFESRVGKKLSLLQFSLPWAKCFSSPCQFLPFPTSQFNAIRSHGAIPVFGWASYSQPHSTSLPDFSNDVVSSGRYDDYIRSWAAAARSWGHPFFLRFDWEMNFCGVWAYSECRNGNGPGSFVKMWRHVHDIFSEQGTDNVTWVWCPNVESSATVPDLAGLYPGGAYVDWTCLDGYNWNEPSWMTPGALFGPTYAKVTESIAPTKPMMIAEVASTESGGSKAAWIKDLLTMQLSGQLSKVKAILWFEKYDNGMDWPIETSRTATSAFAAAIQATRFAPNLFASLSSSPIRPLP